MGTRDQDKWNARAPELEANDTVNQGGIELKNRQP